MPSKLVIVESPAKARTIAGFLGRGFVVESVDRARARPAQRRHGGPRGAEGRGLGPARRGRPPRLQAPLRRPRRPSRRRSPSCAACSRRRTSSTWPPTRTARGSRSPGICSRCCSPGCRCGAWSSTRSPPAPSASRWPSRATSTGCWSTPRRPAASSIASSATRCRRCCGRWCAPASRQGGCRARPSASWWSGSGSGCASAPRRSGTWRGSSPLALPRRAGSVRRSPRSNGQRVASGKDFDAAGRPRNGNALVLDRAAAEALVADLAGAAFVVRVGGAQALPALPLPALPHRHPAAGGGPAAALLRPAHHAGGPAPLRERVHHLHAHRLHRPRRLRRWRRPGR